MSTATTKSRTPRKRKGRKNPLAGFSATVEEQSALDQYLRDVSRHELITPEREKELGALAQKGDEDAIQELARANLRFVISVAKKYQNRGVSLTDLIQEGNVGLVTAARKFDPEQGVKFISYAVWWIRQAILASLANQGRAVRVPLNRASDLARIFREKERLKQELRREPTAEELGEATDLTPELVESLQTLNAAEIRLDAPIGDSEDSQLVERFITEEAAEPEMEVEGRLLSESISEALETLEPRDAKVLRLYFGLEGEREHTLEEIGNMLGVTRERIRQLRDRALRRLRDGIGPSGASVLAFRRVRIDTGSRQVWVDDEPVDLTATEFDLLKSLAEHRGRVLSREQLLEQVWGYDFYGEERVIDVHIGHIRQKLGDGDFIATVRGVGYRFEDEEV